MKLYRLNRHTDVSGVSGTGYVAIAVVFDDNITIVKFETGFSTYPTLEDAIRIHGHQGSTVFENMWWETVDIPGRDAA